MLKGWGSRFWYEGIGVRGFGAGVDRGSRFWCWGGLGFEVLALGWIGVRGFGAGVDENNVKTRGNCSREAQRGARHVKKHERNTSFCYSYVFLRGFGHLAGEGFSGKGG